MAKTSYLGSNLEIVDTFSGWLEQTNKVIYDMGSVVMTVADVAEPNTTNGAWASGNTNLEGIFSSNTVAVQDGLRGGTVSTPATLIVSSNATFDGVEIVVNANTTLNGSNVDITANATLFTSNTVTFDLGVDGNTVFEQGSVYINSNTFIQGATANVDVTTLGISANTEVTASTLTLHVDTISIGADSNDTMTVESVTSFNANVSFADDSILSLGNGGDLKLYHDSNDSYIEDVGTGEMKLRSNGTGVYLESTGGETLAQFITDAGTHLYHNNAQKLVTAADGVDITGSLDVSTDQTVGGTLDVTGVATFNANVDLQDSDRLLIGTDDDLQVYHSGTHSHISDVGTGNLKISGQTVEILGVDDGNQDTMAVFNDGASVDLYHNSIKKLNTKSDGVLISGELESTTLDVNGAANILGATALQNTLDVTESATFSNTMFVAGQSNVASIMVRDLTETRVVFTGPDGELVDNDALNFTFANTTLATANVTVTGSMFISDDLVVVDNVEIDGSLKVDDTTDVSGVGTGSIVTAGGLSVAKSTWLGGSAVHIDSTNGIYLEDKKHGLTFNDGSGNFNLRVGNIRNGSGEQSTGAGYAFHQEYDQSNGSIKLQVSDAALTVGDTPTWREQVVVEPSAVKLAYQGGVKLKTDADGVDVTGDLEASANLVAGHTLTTPRIRGGANVSDAVVVQTNMDVMGATRFGTPGNTAESVGFYGEAIFFNDITLANNDFQMSVANAVITDLTVLGAIDMDLARVTSDLIPDTSTDETNLGNNANTAEIFSNMASRSFSFDADIANSANLGLVAYVDGSEDPFINLNTSTNRWSFFNGSGSKYQIVGKVISGTTDVITVNGGTNSSNTEITVSHKAPAAGVAANSDISVNGSDGVVIQDLDLDFDEFGHVTNASVSTYNLDNRYYTEAESDSRFVNVTGDTMTGPLELQNTSAGSTSKAPLLKVNGQGSDLWVENFSDGDYRLRNTTSNNAIEIYDTKSSGIRITNDDNDLARFANSGIQFFGDTTVDGGGITVIDSGTSELTIEGATTQIHLKNTGDEAQHWVHSNANTFYVLANRWDDDTGDWVGDNSWQAQHPIELNSELNTIMSYGSKVLREVDEGHGNGIDADTTDGLHANTASIASTLVARDSNRSFSANNVTMSGVATASEFVATSSAGLAWENGVSRITNNDGGGDGQIRWGHEYDNGLKYTHAGSAIYVGGDIDSANAHLLLQVADNGGAGAGSTVTFGDALRIYHNNITWDGHRMLTVNDEGSGNNLDADTVDGIEASSLLRSDATDVFTGSGVGSYIRIDDNRELRFGNDSDFTIYYDEGDHSGTQAGSSGSDDLIIDSGELTSKDIRIGYTTGSTLKTQYFFDMSEGDLRVEGDFSLGGSKGGDCGINFWDDNSGAYRTLKWDAVSNDWFIENDAGLSGRLWHANNDGEGSGLDADKLDGKHASTFFTLSENETVTGNTTFNGNVTFSDTATFTIDDTSTAYGTKAAALTINGDGSNFEISNFSSGGYTLGVNDNKIKFNDTTGGITFEYAGAKVASFDATGLETFDQDVNFYGSDNYLQVHGDMYVGSDTSTNDRNSDIHFYDDSGNTWRTLRWNPITDKFEAEASNGSFYPVLTTQDYVGNADTLNDLSSSQFLRTDVDTTKTDGYLKLNDSKYLYLGTDQDVLQTFDGSNYHHVQKTGSTYYDISGNFYIRDEDASDATRFTFSSSTGNLAITGDLSAADVNATAIRLSRTSDVNLSSTNHAFQLGPDSGANLRMDTNEIAAVNNGAPGNLRINEDGGIVYVNSSEVVTKSTLGEFGFRMEDQQKITFGTDNDLELFYDETVNNALTIESNADKDLIITDNGTIRFRFDISNGQMSASKFIGDGSSLTGITQLVKGFISFDGANGQVFKSGGGLTLTKNGTGVYTVNIPSNIGGGRPTSSTGYAIIVSNVDSKQTTVSPAVGDTAANIALSNYNAWVDSQTTSSFVVKATRTVIDHLHYYGNDNNHVASFGVGVVDPRLVNITILY